MLSPMGRASEPGLREPGAVKNELLFPTCPFFGATHYLTLFIVKASARRADSACATNGVKEND